MEANANPSGKVQCDQSASRQRPNEHQNSTHTVAAGQEIKIKTCFGSKGGDVSKQQGLEQGEKLGGGAFSVADRTDSTLCEKNLEEASAVAESGI